MKLTRTMWGVIAIAASAVSLVGCGGGGSGGTAPATSTPVISQGVMAKGSVILNGVRFEDTAAHITADDQAKTAAFLDDGMVVKLKGRRNDDGVTGTAQEIEVENEVRGVVTSIGTGTFVVLGQTVIVTNSTVTAGGWSFDPTTMVITGLSGTVEVHGQRDLAGAIVASRVELLGGGIDDELRGVVSGLSATFSPGDTFDIHGFSITTNGSTMVLPAGSTVMNGTLVEVHLSGTLATQIEVEDAEDVAFEPAEGEAVEIEGYVTTYDNVSDFEVNGRHVHLTGSTRYESGVYADVVDDVKIEVEGHVVSGILQADKVKFKDTVRMEANIAIGGSTTVLERQILITAETEVINGPLGNGNGIRLRGYVNRDGTTVTATRIEKLSNPVASDKSILQGPVSAKNEGTKTLTIVGILVDLSAVPANEIKNDNDDIITLGQFYTSITLNRTTVKVRGTYSAGTLAADKAELE